MKSRLNHSSNRLGLVGRLAVLGAAASLAMSLPARADDLAWPRQFDSPSGRFVVYQPQPEELNGDVLKGRAAFSLQKKGDAHPAFGVLWYTEQISIDRDSSTVIARSLDVTKVRLPGITAEEAGRYENLVEDQAAGWDLSGTVEELAAGLAAAQKERSSVAGIDNTPPRIIFHERRAILVVYDGAPVLRPMEGSILLRAANTPYAVVLDTHARYYYLNGANLWYRSRSALGPWTPITNPPAAIREIVPPDTSTYDQVTGPPPDVLTAIEPTELIATDGPIQYAPLVDDELLYVTNTESDVVLEVSTQNLYVLLSGRWFRAPSTDGPWEFVRGDELPASFREIPPDSPKGNILASVAGTDQADDAIADAEIPQTSAIQRDDQSFEATYDGEPQFAPIAGTDLEYAMNTDAQVILADGRYYACDQGVWYVSDSPYGPWSVSDTRPIGVEDIPPSCPVYDVRYVYVYDSTPDVVYVGYLPGYLGCYPYYGTVVYGTGYAYAPWRSRYEYFPRRFTWGFQARYNPWLTRWSFGLSYGAGFLRVGTRWQTRTTVAQRSVRPAWFGPGGYRRPLVAPDMTFMRTRPPGRTRPRVPDGLPANMYNRPENIVRVDRTVVAPIPVRSIASPVPMPNNVYAGKDGQVYRRDQTGTWEVRKGTSWKRAELPSPPPTPPPPVVQEPDRLPTTEPSQGEVPPEPRGPFVQAPVPQRNDPPAGRPTPPPERPTPPPSKPVPQPERPTTPPEKPTPPPDRPTAPPSKPTPPAAEKQEPRVERPSPPPEPPSPGNLEREFHARQRSEREDKPSTPPPAQRPAPPPKQEENLKAQEPPKEKEQEEGSKEKEQPAPDAKAQPPAK
jgi:hypothetical protein